jgi:Phage integrase family
MRKHWRQREARIHQRIRTLASLLPGLVRAVEQRQRHAEVLLAAIRGAAPGEQVVVDGRATSDPNEAVAPRPSGGGLRGAWSRSTSTATGEAWTWARIKDVDGRVPLVERYDPTERTLSPPLPYLFQRRRRAGTSVVISDTGLRDLLARAARRAGLRDTHGSVVRLTPHDHRRIFATDAVTSGLPIHIVAKILGHLDLNTTRGYTAVYPTTSSPTCRHSWPPPRRQARRGVSRADRQGVGGVRAALRQAHHEAGLVPPSLRHPVHP